MKEGILFQAYNPIEHKIQPLSGYFGKRFYEDSKNSLPQVNISLPQTRKQK